MSEVTWRRLATAWVILAVALGSSAYIGPGVGAGAIVLVVAVVLGVVLLFAGFLWYPIKRMLRSRKQSGAASATRDPAGDA